MARRGRVYILHRVCAGSLMSLNTYHCSLFSHGWEYLSKAAAGGLNQAQQSLEGTR